MLDGEEKTVLRFSIESYASRMPGVGNSGADQRIVLLPVRGYNSISKRVSKILKNRWVLRPWRKDCCRRR